MACLTTLVVGLMERLARVFSRVPFAVPPVTRISLALEDDYVVLYYYCAAYFK